MAFVGKLIVNKGVDLLIAAWPLVLEQVPQARLEIVGFGGDGEWLELLLQNWRPASSSRPSTWRGRSCSGLGGVTGGRATRGSPDAEAGAPLVMPNPPRCATWRRFWEGCTASGASATARRAHAARMGSLRGAFGA